MRHTHATFFYGKSYTGSYKSLCDMIRRSGLVGNPIEKI